MSRRTRDVVRTDILRRCSESGLGAACAEAQADGVPCGTPDGECTSCERGAAAVAAQLGRSPATRAAAAEGGTAR